MIKLRKAKAEDLEYIVKSNDLVNEVSGLTNGSKLKENFEKDFLSKNPKAFCMIAEESGVKLAMCIYSFVYWANKGQGIYLANVYVEETYRRHGVLKMILEYLKNIKDVNFITMFVGNENENMQKTILHYGAEDADLKTFYLK